MQSHISEISPVLIEVKVEIPWDRVEKDLNDSYRKMGQTARIKGFRPGKVPRNVVKQIFGRQVRGEVTAQLVEQGLLQAVTEHELQIVAQPEVDAPTLEDGKPLNFSAKIEVRPKIEEVELNRLEVARPKTEVATEAVDEEVERLRHQHSELRTPEPMRPAKAGDELLIDYSVSVDGEVKQEMGATDRHVELGGDRLLPEFEEGLVGSQPKDEKTITVNFPEDHGGDDMKGKEAIFQVTIKELRERLLPELDDEFAKDCGDYETLLELRLKLREQLEQMANRKAEAELKDKLIDKLVELNPIPIPPSMVKQEQLRMLQEFAQIMQMSGQQPNLPEDFQKDMEVRAERKVRAAIVLGALARTQSIAVEDTEIEQELARIAEQTGKHIAKVRVDYQGERREGLESELLEQKLMDYLMEKATILDAPAEEKASAEAQSDSGAGAKSDKKAPAKKMAAKKKATKKAAADSGAESE